MRALTKVFSVLAGLGMLASAAQAQVVVSSKIDTEGAVIGNIIQQVLEANGIATVDKISLGPTPIVRAAITAGEIDIYPDRYTFGFLRYLEE